MHVWVRGVVGAALMLLSVVVGARAAVPAVNGIGIEDRLDAPSVILDAVPSSGPPLPFTVFLIVDDAPSAAALNRLDARLQAYAARHLPVVLVMGGWPSAAGDQDVARWREGLRAIVQRVRGRAVAYVLGSPADSSTSAAPYAFLLKQASVLIRSIDADALVVQGSVPADGATWLSRVYAEGTAAYVDAVMLAAPAGGDDEALRTAVTAIREAITAADPTSSLWLGPVTIPDGTAGTRKFMDTAMRGLAQVNLTVFQGATAAIRAGLAAAGPFRDLLSGEIVTLDSASVRWPNRAAVPSSRLLYGLSTGDTYIVYESDVPAGKAEIEIDLNMSAPAVRDPRTGQVDRLTPPPADHRGPAQFTVPVAEHPLVLDLNYGQSVYLSTAAARESGLPPVEEIIARQQQVQTAQTDALRNYIAHVRIEMRFHPTPADPAYALVTENQLFSDASGTEWAEEGFSLNGATWKANRPSFPLLQPEKVLSLPLDLRLTQDYRYRLEGVERVDGREAFVVRFDPRDSAQALYRGTVWIDRETFVRLKVSAVETHGSGVVQSNEEEQVFTNTGVAGGRPIWLLTHLVSRQTILVAGRTILNERDVRLSDVRLNVPDFDARRAEVRGGSQVMYRDTDRGVRYFVKRGDTRVVSEELTTSARALAMGIDVDPSLQYPLPILGLDILDFNFLKRDLQLAVLFGGVLGLGNIQRAGMLGGRLDASLDFFGLAVTTDDRVFDADGERAAERVRTAPLSTGLNLGFRLSPSHKISARLEIRHDRYAAGPDTAADFTPPSSTTTAGEGLGYEFRRRGYSVTASATAYQRSHWTPWGRAGTFDPSTGTYARYDAGISKDFTLAPFQSIHLNGQYFGGTRLDRFSMYQFGMFDATRMHGVPSAVRFSDLVMLRASYSFNLFDQYRLDLFADHAVGRDAGLDRSWRPVTGIGASVNFKGPHSTIIKADIGRSVLPALYRGAGSTVLQILILKPL
jgi:hypothetical protein